MRFYRQKKLLTERRKKDKYQKQVYSQVLQDVLLRLDNAYQAFFKGIARYPKFKRRGKYNSFTYPQVGGFTLDGQILRLGLIGRINVKAHRHITGIMKTCTVIRDIDQWYACIVTESDPEIRPAKTEAIGVDLGLLKLAVLSNGEIIENPRFVNSCVHEIKYLQHQLSRRQKGSKNRERVRIRLAKTWQRVRRQRDDYTHKVSAHLASKYGVVVFEDLHIPKIVKNHNLAAAIMDATWGKLRLYTAYKVERRGGRIIVVNPNGTSQKCSSCGNVVKKDLSVRVHRCSRCGLVIDRDHNAALNILKLGLEQAHAETEPILVKRTSKFQSRKQETHDLRSE